MAARPRVGRSREELLAAAAALTAAAEDLPDEDEATAVVLLERVRALEEESLDAPPISAAGEVTDDRALMLVWFLWPTAVASFLAHAGVPQHVARGVAGSSVRQALRDPLARQELLEGMRHALAGNCSCGEPVGHPHEDHTPGGETT